MSGLRTRQSADADPLDVLADADWRGSCSVASLITNKSFKKEVTCVEM